MPYKDKQKKAENNRKWRENNPDYYKNWKEQHPDKTEQDKDRSREYQRKWRESHPELHKERQKKWREENPEKYREIHRKRAKERRPFIDSVKQSYGCQNPECPCEGNLPACCLDFHHLGNKKSCVALLCSASFKRLCKEINQCTVLCAVCHRMETFGLLNASSFQRCVVEPL